MKSLLIQLGLVVVIACLKEVKFECLKGIVIGTENNCNSSEGLGTPYLVKIDSSTEYDTIMTTTLPEAFKKEGLEIYFNIRHPSHSIYCNALINCSKTSV